MVGFWALTGVGAGSSRLKGRLLDRCLLSGGLSAGGCSVGTCVLVAALTSSLASAATDSPVSASGAALRFEMHHWSGAETGRFSLGQGLQIVSAAQESQHLSFSEGPKRSETPMDWPFLKRARSWVRAGP